LGVETVKTVVHGISVTNVGKTIASMSGDELAALDGIGGVVSESLMEWFNAPGHKDLLEKFERNGVVCLVPPAQQRRAGVRRKNVRAHGHAPHPQPRRRESHD
jgi:NAD-dependent DNA ligase